MEENVLLFLKPTEIIDCDNRIVRQFAREAAGVISDPVEMAVKLYLSVRDGIRYDPYSPFYLPEHYRASYVLKRGRSFCVPKASILCALGRASGIPSRVGLATVRNHLATKQLIDFLGTDLFVSHGFVEFYLEGKWVKATPAFNRELCLRHHVSPLEFNGREDSLFQPYNSENQKFMEYIRLEGIFADIPVEHILTGWKKVYGEDRVNGWIRRFEEQGDRNLPLFETEEVLNQ